MRGDSGDTAIRQLLVALCRNDHALSPQVAASLTHLDKPETRAAFLSAARELRVLGLVLIRLERDRVFQTLDNVASAELETLLRQTRRRAGELELERDRVVVLLERGGVTPVVLKGAGLRGVLYDEPAERHAADIDLLVDESEVEKALAVMQRARYQPPEDAAADAYRREHFHFRLHHPLGYVVEIHWALGEPRRAFQLGAAGFLRETLTLARGTRPPLRLPRHELGLLHLVLQNVQERFRWFNRLVDVDRFVKRTTIDWNYLERHADMAGLRVPFTLTCQLTTRLLGTQFPPETIERLMPATSTRVHLAMLEPEHFLLRPSEPRRSAADRLLDLWLTPPSHSKVATIASWLTVAGFIDPRHVEMGHIARPGVATRVLAVMKALGYQLVLYARGATALSRTLSKSDQNRG